MASERHVFGNIECAAPTLARIVGKGCSIDLLIDDIRAELAGRPYDLVPVAGGWKHLTRPAYAGAIRAAAGVSRPNSSRNSMVVT